MAFNRWQNRKVLFMAMRADRWLPVVVTSIEERDNMMTDETETVVTYLAGGQRVVSPAFTSFDALDEYMRRIQVLES